MYFKFNSHATGQGAPGSVSSTHAIKYLEKCYQATALPLPIISLYSLLYNVRILGSQKNLGIQDLRVSCRAALHSKFGLKI